MKILKLVTWLELKILALRRAAIRGQLRYCGRQFQSFGRFEIVCPEKLEIGDNFSINHGAYVNARGGVVIGNNVAVSAGAMIISTGLDKSELSAKVHVDRPIHIGDSVQIGAGAIILAGVHIGSNVIIGAGSILTKDAQENSIYCGVPACRVSGL